jgi:hypothetical protein
MSDVQQIIDALLAKWPAGFRNKHLAEALGVSRARACQLLAPRVRSGELARKGEGRGKYIRGPDCGIAPSIGAAREAFAGGFWSALMQNCPHLAYVAFSRLALTELRTRQQLRAALRGVVYRAGFLVLDFEGVNSISRAAAHELLFRVPQVVGTFVAPINLEPAVARTVQQVLRFGY